MTENERWQCPACGIVWPEPTVVVAYRKHLTAGKYHPGKTCQELFHEDVSRRVKAQKG
jgi:hypothetical protein